MHNQENPIPSWQPYADEVVTRLKAHHTRQAKAQGKPNAANPVDTSDDASPAQSDQETDSAHALLDDLLMTDDYPHLPSDAAEALREAGADPQATLISGDDRLAIRLPSHRLSLAIRLAATIGDETAMRHYTAPGELTLVTGFEPYQLKTAAGLFYQQFFAPEQTIFANPRHPDADGAYLLLLPDTHEGEISTQARHSFHREINRALDRDTGLLLLAPDISYLPPELHPGIQSHLRLAPLSRDVLITHLRHSHSATGRIDQDAMRKALPDDRCLATLPFTALRLALRAPTGRMVAERITARMASIQRDGPDLDAMTGDGPALTAARRLIADLRLWQDDKIAWLDLSRSMLLYGPPGTGKTWLARAMGNSAGIAMVEASFAIWQSAGHLGDMLREMRKSFAEARRLAPSILFIDEIDSVGSRNSGDRHGSSYQRQVINAFLGEMNSIVRDEGVIVIGACNHIDRIDPAVIRAGRFDIKVQMPLPDAFAIRGILQKHLGKAFADGELQTLATASVGRSAAEIDAAIRTARSEARHARTALSLGMIRHHLGTIRNAREVAADWRTALHECGHAIVGTVLGCGKITRVMLTSAGGETHRRVMTHQGLLSNIEAELAYMLAGRAAENLILGDIASGAGGPAESDIAQATRLALAIDTTLGLGADGPVWTAAPDHELLRDPVIHARVRKRLEAAEQHAEDILEAHEPLLREMAGILHERREFGEAELGLWLSKLENRDRQPGNQ